MARDNKTIGRFSLDGIPPAPRGVPQIEVTFDIDANGILHVTAKDKATGKEQKISITASSGLSDDEIKRMRDEAKANENADREAKEKIDKLNHADSLIFQTEKQLKEFGDKLPADKKKSIEEAVGKLKAAHASQDLSAIDEATKVLNELWNAASQQMYNAGAQAGPQDAGAGAGAGAGQGANAGGQKDESVTDVDFEEVK